MSFQLAKLIIRQSLTNTLTNAPYLRLIAPPVTKHELGQSTKTSKAPCHRQPSLTQLTKHCLFANKFSRNVEFAASQSYLLNSIATRLNARPVYTRQSLKQTMQYKHLLSHTSYVMQTPATQGTCCLCKPLHQIPAKRPRLSDTPTKREIDRNLGRISSLNFRHKPT